MRIFEGGNTSILCSGGIQSSGCLPPFAPVVAKRYKTMLWRAETKVVTG